MKTKDILKKVGKGIITASSMVAINEIIGYHANPYKSATGTRLLCNIAGASIGFALGRIISDEVIDYISDFLESEGE